MVRITDRGSVIEHALGSLGLFLLGLTGWAAERLQGRAPIAAVLARLGRAAQKVIHSPLGK